MTTSTTGAFDGVFDHVAGEYDTDGVAFFKPLAERLVGLIAPTPGQRILDVGCGRGAVTFPLARAVGPTGSVIGIDLSPRMVEALAVDVTALGVPNVEARVMDGADPDFPANHFDAITGSMSIVMIPELAKAFANYAELLRPGGILAFSAPDTRSQIGAWRTGPIDIGRLAAEIPPQVLDERPMLAKLVEGNLLDLSRVKAELQASGFTGIQEITEDVRVVAQSPEGVVRWTQQHGMRAVWDAIPVARRAAVEDEMVAEATRQADAEGRLVFGFPVALFVARTPAATSEA